MLPAIPWLPLASTKPKEATAGVFQIGLGGVVGHGDGDRAFGSDNAGIRGRR
jgi:hypothetical protein